jgi:hypothetical protein
VRAVALAVGGLTQLAPPHEISIKVDTYLFLRLTRCLWGEDSPTVSGAPLFFWAGVLGVKPTNGGTVGFSGELEAAAVFITGKGAVFDPPIDALKGKDRVRA